MISVVPAFVILIFETVLNICQSSVKNDFVFLDATGNVCKALSNCSKFLCYEMCVHNPHSGEPDIPIAGLVTNDQSEVTLRSFFNKFLHCEKTLFGCGHRQKPLHIRIGRSYVLKLLLHSSNCETVQEFSARAYRVAYRYCFG